MNKYKRVLLQHWVVEFQSNMSVITLWWFFQATMTENVSQFYVHLYVHYLSLLQSHPRDILTRRSFISFYYDDDFDAGQIIYCICFVNSDKVK